VIGSLAIGGAETQLVRLVNGLDRRRFKPSIICLVEGGDLEKLLATDVSVIMPPGPSIAKGTKFRRIIVRRRTLMTLIRGLHRQRPKIVHAYMPAAYVPASLIAWCFRVPLIVAGRRGITTTGLYGTLLWNAIARLSNRVIDLQISNSNAACELAILREGVRQERTRVIHNGIDLPPLKRIALPPELASDGTQAVMVANFIGYKGHALVLRAVARVVERHPEFRLVLMGDGPERTALERLCSGLGLNDHVVFAGRQPDAAHLIQGFDFSILGSSEESLPNALMESMAVAVPVVSTRVGGVPELVDDGMHGKLVPYGDVGAMADAIVWMVEHPSDRRRMGEAGRRRIGADFSTDRMVSRCEDAYEEFLSMGAPSPATT
jgi:glycosyltransferase involved in cell wall biosynthesis